MTGRLKESMEHYQRAEAIYDSQLPEGDMAFASLYNNEGLLYEEMREYDRADRGIGKSITDSSGTSRQ